MKQTREGWTWLMNAVKWRYFVGGRSLCGKYLILGYGNEFEVGRDDSPDNCAGCRRKLAKRSAQAAKLADHA